MAPAQLCLVVDDPRHPVMARLAGELRIRHQLRVLSTCDPRSVRRAGRQERDAPADLYLLKAHSPAALLLALRLERAGATVVNGAAATLGCLDRRTMARKARAAGLPCPETWCVRGPLGELTWDAGALPYPVVVKSRWSRRHDLVRLVGSPADLCALAREWPQERVVVQRYALNDALDRKLYVTDWDVFCLHARSPLLGGATERVAAAMPAGLAHLARAAGRVFGLRVYGVDVVITPDGPLVVDVNPFPGFRDVPEAHLALAGMVDRLALAARKDRRQ